MKIHVNSKEHDAPDGCTVALLVDQLNFGQKRLAVEVNTELVVKAQWATHILKPGDRIEIVSFVGGG